MPENVNYILLRYKILFKTIANFDLNLNIGHCHTINTLVSEFSVGYIRFLHIIIVHDVCVSLCRFEIATLICARYNIKI